MEDYSINVDYQPDETVVSMQDIPAFDARYFQMDKVTPNTEGIGFEGDIEIKQGKYTGTITSHFKETLENCAVLFYGRLIYLGDMEPEVFYDNTDKGKILIDVDDLIYIETCERNTKIHTREDTYISSKKMKEHERLLQGYTFCRCHASYIVNLSYVRSIDGLSLFLKDGTEIQISKSRRGKFMEAFAKYVDSVIRF